MKLKQLQKHNPQYLEAGYTLIESLVAMIMVAALMVAVAPVIVFSAGTRVQARRVELAAQAARSYMDAVRLGELDPPSITALVPSEEKTEQTAPVNNALGTCDPVVDDNLEYCPDDSPIVSRTFGKFYCVDTDGDGVCTSKSLTDMMVLGGILISADNGQNYRNQMIGANANDEDVNLETKRKLGYSLLVMVYRANAFSDNNFKISNQLPPTIINNAGLATRSSDGTNEIERPLFIGTTEITPTSNSFQNLRERLQQD